MKKLTKTASVYVYIDFAYCVCYNVLKAGDIVIKAKFKKKYIGNIICLVCGLLLIAFSMFFEEKVVGIVLGSIFSAFNIIILLFNAGAYLYLEDGRIKGKYHLFGKIDCAFSDVDFSFAQTNTLTIQLKNGKRHTIFGIENSIVLSFEIQSNLKFEATDSPSKILETLKDLELYTKKITKYVYLGVVLMFINLIITIVLTGERDLVEFSKTDWVFMIAFGIIEFAIVIATFYFAQKAGKNKLPIIKMYYVLYRTLIETTPLLPGNAKMVFTDWTYTYRITVFGYPNEKSVYYVSERVGQDYDLIKDYESELFEDEEYFPGGFEYLIDITDKFLRKE